MDWPEQLRADARAIFEAGVAAVEPRRLVRDTLEQRAEDLTGQMRVAAVGKAAVAMTHGALDVLGDRVAGGVVIAPPSDERASDKRVAPAVAPPSDERVAPAAAASDKRVAPVAAASDKRVAPVAAAAASPAPGPLPKRVALFGGGHPIPKEAGVAGARAILEMALKMGEGDTLVCLISGGGSALMTLPLGELTLGDLQESTELLLRAGATIGDLNCFRKHVDRLKGGRLAAAAAPARIVALVLSDVVGDPLDVIASGPVSPDPTTFADALGVAERFGVADSLPAAVRKHLEAGVDGRLEESPKAGDPCFDRVEAVVIGNNRMAAEAALEIARACGYEAWISTTELTGEARLVGAALAAEGLTTQRGEHGPDPPACLVAAGETTVTVRGSGRGGRNQELALGAALALAGTERILVASMGTDGIDGPTDAAGAWADGSSRARAEAAGIDVEERLALNDSYRVFEALGDLIVTGPTGTNVMDLMLVLVAP